MSEITFIPLPRPFQYRGSWEDVTGSEYDPGKAPFTGNASIQYADQLRVLDASDLYFATLEWEQNTVFDRILEATNESGQY